MKTRNGFRALAAALAAAGLAGCTHVTASEIEAGSTPSLAGSEWQVTKMGSAAIVSGKEPSIRFTEDGKIAGTTGCNRFFGTYAQEAAKVTFSGTGATKMACLEDNVMQQEATFLAILQGQAQVSADPPTPRNFTVTGANGISFTGVRVQPAPNEALPEADFAALKGGVWIVEDINRTGVIDNSRLTLSFGEEGRVSGSTNCNGFGGTYSVDGTKLTLGALAMTRRACLAEALSNQERKYTSALQGELSWTITDDGALELTGAEGRRVLLRR